MQFMLLIYEDDGERVGRVSAAYMPMKKLDLATLEAAHRGEGVAK